jgi:hypothetical protein
MLLDLMLAKLGARRTSVTSLCIAASVPSTTGPPWIEEMTKRGVPIKKADQADRRRFHIGFTDMAADAMAGWLNAAEMKFED